MTPSSCHWAKIPGGKSEGRLLMPSAMFTRPNR
jgi:hypothetical protein